jgi:hypothetical protein
MKRALLLLAVLLNSAPALSGSIDPRPFAAGKSTSYTTEELTRMNKALSEALDRALEQAGPGGGIADSAARSSKPTTSYVVPVSAGHKVVSSEMSFDAEGTQSSPPGGLDPAAIDSLPSHSGPSRLLWGLVVAAVAALIVFAQAWRRRH